MATHNHSVFLYRERAAVSGLDKNSFFRLPGRIKERCSVILNELALIESIDQSLEVSLSLLCDSTMQEKNKVYRQKNKTTDVLSFSQIEGEQFPALPGESAPLMLGDILISVPVCLAQAEEIGHSVQDEFERLFVHGLFHLLGYDHERSKKDEKIMFAKEEKLHHYLSKC